MSKLHCALGLMSGTSLDGIDVALIETDGADEVRRGPARTYGYDDGQRRRLRQALEIAKALQQRDERPGELAAIERELTDWHADAVCEFCAGATVTAASIDIIGFHGQTVIHRPERRLTVQLGDGARLAQRTGIAVIADLRAADVAAGGQGAPLAPVYHRALAASLNPRPAVFLNLGGVANVTFIGRDGEMLAFDTGPGNALLNDWCERHLGEAFDRGGELARAGRADQRILAQLLQHDYFNAAPPKSLDRNSFDIANLSGLSPADGAATLTAFTAAAIAQSAARWFSAPPQTWIACGGGRHNPTLMAAIRTALSVPVLSAEEAGFDGDSMEAEAWGYLAVRSLKGLAITCPGTTRAPAPLTGGVRFDA